MHFLVENYNQNAIEEAISNMYTGLKLRLRNRKIIFLFLSQNRCCGYSKELFFGHPKHLLRIMGKKIFTIVR